VCRDPARSAEVEESFKDSRRTKFIRKSAFAHRETAARIVEVEKPFGGFIV
jgi:hypothetical protein